MSPAQQNIAIAEACGKEPWWKCPEHSQIDGPVCRWCGNVATLEDCPDYTGSLDAMHEAERILTQSQCHAYNNCLLYNAPYPRYSEGFARQWSWGASAAQRAEAFLRALNLWEGGAS